MRYRRTQADGGTWFFTVNLEDRQSRLLLDHVDDLRNAMRVVKERHPFTIVAMIVMPEHLHTIWQLPPGDGDYALRWSLVKAGFSRKVAKGEAVNKSRAERGERGIWQRRYWEHQIQDDDGLQRHVDYIHYNPVKHGHARRAADWPHSSIHHYIKDGLLDENWGASTRDNTGRFGER